MGTFRSSDCSTALGWGPSGLDSHRLLRRGWPGLSWVPTPGPEATPLQRLAWQIGVFVGSVALA
ncbi:MAG TPA: hypothetical protein VJ456_09160 [Acidimicrobiia bacterium]|nr:hypothetical protein [Acidimicrobiia bacterium]